MKIINIIRRKGNYGFYNTRILSFWVIMVYFRVSIGCVQLIFWNHKTQSHSHNIIIVRSLKYLFLICYYIIITIFYWIP